MVNEIYFHNNKTMNYVLANINYGSGLPSTSEGEGEIYYNTVDNTLYLNTGTAGTPSWGAIGGGSWIGSATSNLDMNNYAITEVGDIDLNDSVNNNIKCNGSTAFQIGVDGIFPQTDSSLDLATNLVRFYRIYADYLYGTVSDLVWLEHECEICKKQFKIGDILNMIVIKFNDKGETHTVPVHQKCVSNKDESRIIELEERIKILEARLDSL